MTIASRTGLHTGDVSECLPAGMTRASDLFSLSTGPSCARFASARTRRAARAATAVRCALPASSPVAPHSVRVRKTFVTHDIGIA